MFAHKHPSGSDVLQQRDGIKSVWRLKLREAREHVPKYSSCRVPSHLLSQPPDTSTLVTQTENHYTNLTNVL